MLKVNRSLGDSSSLNTSDFVYPQDRYIFHRGSQNSTYGINGRQSPSGLSIYSKLTAHCIKETDIKTPKEWAQIYKETVLYPVTYERGCRTYHLRSGDPKVARKVRRKAGFRERSIRLIWAPFYQAFFEAEFSSRGHAIRSLERILGKKKGECWFDPKRSEIKVKRTSQEKGVAS